MGCSSSTQSPQSTTVLPREIHVTLRRHEGQGIGANLRSNEGQPVIVGVDNGSILMQWNAKNPKNKVGPGDKIVAVNRECENFWSMAEELRSDGLLHIVVLPGPWPTAPAPAHTVPENIMAKLPYVRADDCDMTSCRVCLDTTAPDEMLVQLPCQHAFHPGCATRWLTQCSHTCPLCAQPVPLCSPTAKATADTEGVVLLPSQVPQGSPANAIDTAVVPSKCTKGSL
jgi:hypothetical protein